MFLCRSFHIVFWVKSDLGRAHSFYLAGWRVPVSDVSHLFWGLKLRDTRVPTGVRFFFFFQFWGCSDCSRQVLQLNEADNYAWTPDTVKMSLIPVTWLVVVSVLLICSHLGSMTAKRDPMETQLWYHVSACCLCYLKVLIGMTGKVKNVVQQ